MIKYAAWMYHFLLFFSDSGPDIDGLVQGRRNSIANALELRLSCTNPSTSYIPLSDNRGLESGAIRTQEIFPQIHTIATMGSLAFVSFTFDLCSASVTPML